MCILLFSTLVELQPEKVVRPSVLVFTENRSNDFSENLHGVGEHNCKKSDGAVFSKKNHLGPKLGVKPPISRPFRLFRENGSNDFVQTTFERCPVMLRNI